MPFHNFSIQGSTQFLPHQFSIFNFQLSKKKRMIYPIISRKGFISTKQVCISIGYSKRVEFYSQDKSSKKSCYFFFEGTLP